MACCALAIRIMRDAGDKREAGSEEGERRRGPEATLAPPRSNATGGCVKAGQRPHFRPSLGDEYLSRIAAADTHTCRSDAAERRRVTMGRVCGRTVFPYLLSSSSV